MGQFDTLMQCMLGSTSFQLENYSYQEQPIIVTDVGRVGSTISVKGTGWIQGNGTGDFGSLVLGMPNAYRQSGQDFAINGLGGNMECQVTAAMCVENGPHMALTIENQSESLIKPISFELTAKTAITNASLPLNSYTNAVTTRPDGLKSVQRNGQLTGSTDALAALGAFEASYPQDSWVISWQATSNQLGLTVSYAFTAVELAQQYPAGAGIVDGELVVRTDRDEQYRLATTYDYDVLADGPGAAVAAALREDAMARQTLAAGGGGDSTGGSGSADATLVIRETVSISTFKETRIRASFEFLQGGDGNRLLSWGQTIDYVDDEDAYAVQQYNGAGAVLIKQPATLSRIVQQGQAIGLGAFPMPPDPIISDSYLERPRITLQAINAFECQTTWNYVMAADDSFTLDDNLGALTRPSDPSFYGGGG